MTSEPSGEDFLAVMPISPGIAVGPARVYKPANASMVAMPAASVAPAEVAAEQQRLRAAIHAAVQELQRIGARVAKTVGRSEAGIFEAQQLMLEDPEILSSADEAISGQYLPAATAYQQAAEQSAQVLESLANETLAARAADIRDVAARVARLLNASGQNHLIAVQSDEPVIIVARDLAPSDTANFDPDSILGICTVVGGPTTHAAIIARAMEIPAVAGLDPRLLDTLSDGQQLAIDGTRGQLYLSFDEEQARTLRDAMLRRQQQRAQRRGQNEALYRSRPGSTADGVATQIYANVGDADGASAAARAGAEGIGLLRTEFLFGGRAVFPGEQEQFESYVALFRAFADHALFGKTIIARTLDAGADKPFPALEPLIGALQEANPALGLRGARIHLVHEALLRDQLRALLRAGGETGVTLAIMFPMIATLEEVRRLRAIYHSVASELAGEGIAVPSNTQVGIMVETPAAALMADVLAREVDFFSIGANDLFQYTMAADRTNTRVTAMFGALEPAVWRAIDMVVQAAVSHGKLVAVCGELAADPRIGPLLAGLGVQELSMSPPSIPNVKAALHAHPLDYWRGLARKLLDAETAADAQEILQSIT